MKTLVRFQLFVQHGVAAHPVYQPDGETRWSSNVAWQTVPRKGEYVRVGDNVLLARVTCVEWTERGTAIVRLGCDQLSHDQAVALGAQHERWMSPSSSCSCPESGANR